MEIRGLRQPPFDTTLLGVVKGVSDYYDLGWDAPMLYGGSGHAFVINIHEQICPSGPYCWNQRRFFELLSNLGIEVTDLGFYHAGSTPPERAGVERRLREALDKGLACSLVNMEHQLITGYDGDVFHAAQPWPDCNDFAPATLSSGTWREFGDEVHVNFYLYRVAPPRDGRVILRESLEHAVDLWKRPGAYAAEGYGIGPDAYDRWSDAVGEHGASHGNWWNATVWSECRTMAARYFGEEVASIDPASEGPARELAADYSAIADLLGRSADRELAAETKARLIASAKEREASAVAKIAELLTRPSLAA